MLGLTTDEIIAGIQALKPMFGRSEVIADGKSGITIVQDCYNANPDSMEKAIDLLSSAKSGAHYLVLADMLELGTDSLEEHKKIIRHALDSSAAVVLLGKEMSAALAALGSAAVALALPDSCDESIHKVASYLKGIMKKGDAVLIKGSRGMALERLTAELLGHE